jgi:hypothetical protein
MVDRSQRRRLEALVAEARKVLHKAAGLALEQNLDDVELRLTALWIDVLRLESALMLAQNPSLRRVGVDVPPPWEPEMTW